MEYTYHPDLSELNVIKTDAEQSKQFFYKGHPDFLVPDFANESGDIWQTYMDYLERIKDAEIFDQDGGEITSYKVINPETGLTECTYEAYGINFDEDGDMVDYEVRLEGYVVEKNGNTFFVTTFVNDGLE